MSNHYHLVVKLCPEQAGSWSNEDVLNRWTSLFKGPLLVQRYQAGDDLHEPERRTVKQTIGVYRQSGITTTAGLTWTGDERQPDANAQPS